MAQVTSTIASVTGTAVKVERERAVGVLMDPDDWTAATLGFDVTLDGTNWYPLHDLVSDSDGSAIAYTVVAAKYYALNPAIFAGAIAIRPTSSAPQNTHRVLTFVTLAVE